ncbi:MAG: hypothetical protein ACP5UN_00895 [Candidatus Micrarchaeia archaeon]
MSFYGFILLISIITAIIIVNSIFYTSNIFSLSNFALNSYTSILKINTFILALNNTQPQNNIEYTNWLNQINISARIDGISLIKKDNVFIVYNPQNYRIYYYVLT